MLSLSGFGAPQRHAQRSFNQPVGYWDSEYAHSLGADTTNAKIGEFDTTNTGGITRMKTEIKKKSTNVKISTTSRKSR